LTCLAIFCWLLGPATAAAACLPDAATECCHACSKCQQDIQDLRVDEASASKQLVEDKSLKLLLLVLVRL
jgi:hypothetical protein